jgi:hypothetical protein
VIGRTQKRFWKSFHALPAQVQKLAREKYTLWKRDPYHSSLHFEERRNSVCVIRIGEHYRAAVDSPNAAVRASIAAEAKQMDGNSQ